MWNLGLLNSCWRLLCPLSSVVFGIRHTPGAIAFLQKGKYCENIAVACFFFLFQSLLSNYFVLGRSRFNLEFTSLLSLQQLAEAIPVKSQNFQFIHAQQLARVAVLKFHLPYGSVTACSCTAFSCTPCDPYNPSEDQALILRRFLRVAVVCVWLYDFTGWI